MEEIKKEQPVNNLNKAETPLLDTQKEVVENKSDATTQEKINTTDIQQETQLIKSVYSKSVIDKKKNTKIVTTDRIAIFGLTINIILAVFTYLLFKEATSSTKTATDAVQEARRSNSISEKNYALAKEAFEESKKSEQESSKFANKYLSTQINSLKENQQQFKIGNEPYLNIGSSSIEVFENGKPLLTKIKLENLGKYPCKVINCKTIITIRIIAPPFNEINNMSHDYSDILNKYILNGNSVPSPFWSTVPINENQINAVSKSNYFIFLTGYIKYKNIITNQIKTYKFQLKMKPGYETENVINENIDN